MRRAIFALTVSLALTGCPTGGSNPDPAPAAGSVDVPQAPPKARGARIAGSKLAEEDRLGRSPAYSSDVDEDLDPLDPHPAPPGHPPPMGPGPGGPPGLVPAPGSDAGGIAL